MKFSLPMVVALALFTSAGAADAETITIVIDKMAFIPAEVAAKTGDTIEWINKDVFAHTATAKGSWEVMLPVKKSGNRVMENAGTVDYYCRLHPNMKGRITVSAP